MSNRNRQEQRAARALSRAKGLPYQVALGQVRAIRAGKAANPAAAPIRRIPAEPRLVIPDERMCWFCGAPGPLSREHVVARWLVSAMHGQGDLHHAYVEPGETEPARTWSKPKPDFVAKVVCTRCNNGWMSALETENMQLIGRLMAGHDTDLEAHAGRRLARWAAKTVLMFQAMEPRANRAAPASVYGDLHAAQDLPPTIRVWAGKVMAQGVWQTSFSGTLRHRGRVARHFTALLTLDRLCLMVMASEAEDLLGAVELSHLGNAWIDLGSIDDDVTWPPPFVFQRDQFAAMPELLARLARIPPDRRPS